MAKQNEVTRNFDKLEVGKTYKNRVGKFVKINSINLKYNYPFLGDDGECYTELGIFSRKINNSEKDLIKLVGEKGIEHNPIKPTHYNSEIEPLQFIQANNLNFIEGNIVKYVARYKEKNGLEDLKKAQYYLNYLIENYKA